jgi:hypothetical protein
MASCTTDQNVLVIITFRTSGGSSVSVCYVTIQVEASFIGGPCDIEDIWIVLQQRSVLRKRVTFRCSIFLQWLSQWILYGSDRISIQCWLQPQSVVLNVAHFFWTSCYWLPCWT